MLPAVASRLAHLQVQMKRPLCKSRMQGGSTLWESAWPCRLLSLKLLYATQSSTITNSTLKSPVSSRCASQTPAGANNNPVAATSSAARYQTVPVFRPTIAPIEAAIPTASKPIGPACATVNFNPNTSSGTARMPPPAPVSPMTSCATSPVQTIGCAATFRRSRRVWAGKDSADGKAVLSPASVVFAAARCTGG